MSARPSVDFVALLDEAGIPTTDEAITAELKRQVEASGSLISNDSAVSPFWRLVKGVVVTPAAFLLRTLLAGYVLPNSFAATAKAAYLDLKAWDVDLTRKPAQKTRGLVDFVKANPADTITIQASIWISTERINGVVYRLRPVQTVVSPAGEAVAQVVCEAEKAGVAYNLAPGYYNLLSEPITGIVSASNGQDWITQVGSDEEDDDSLGLRIQNQFSAVSHYHIDSVYRSMLASVAGVRPDQVYFEHDGPRGPGTANAYILLDVGPTPDTLIAQLNDYVTVQGNHGHGDDLQVFPLADTLVDVSVTLWPVANLEAQELADLLASVEALIRAAFRESTAYPDVTRTAPRSRFSFSQLTRELHETFPALASLDFANADIVSQLAIPRLASLEVITA
ncbi:baseplate J/gp47 family protein [Aeromonas hydrophila]|nr:baseplate J/gp47 family protein [Aeromonas hydrophila]KHN58855.1 phage protein [Aeromonas hydrophila]OFC46927.1 hypothetical protein BA189_11020 [Aeromonas hydrophila]OFC55126.1 hypothetical protein BA188_04105 [Aeromonas hydrophila]